MFNLSRSQSRRVAHGTSYFFLTLVGVTMILPLAWMVVTSFKRPADDVLNPKEWWPRLPWRLEKTDIYPWPVFCQKLIKQGQSSVPSPGRRIWELIEPKNRKMFVKISKRDHTPVESGKYPRADQIILETEYSAMRVALHEVLKQRDFYNQQDFKGINVSESSLKLLADPQTTVDQFALANRLIFDASYPQLVTKTHRLQWENYKYVVVSTNFGRALFNSAFMTLAITLGTVFTSSLAAFAFARLDWVGRDKVFVAYLATMMIPGAVTLIPTFILVRTLGWVNTYWGLIIPGMFSAWGTFMLRQFFMSIPRVLEDAAFLDGCSIWGVYRHVALPLSVPALAALSILTFMGVWREFMWPLIVTNTPDMYTLAVALASFKEMYGVKWQLMMAGSVIMIIPMLLVYIFGQRYFMEGIKLGAVKG